MLKLKTLSFIITLFNFLLSLNAHRNVSNLSILLNEISIVVRFGQRLKLPVGSVPAPPGPKSFNAQYEAVSYSKEGQYPKLMEERS